MPTVKPGYLRPLIPEEAPEDPENWQNVMNDLDRVIMPGVTHWHSPQFHAYFPTANRQSQLFFRSEFFFIFLAHVLEELETEVIWVFDDCDRNVNHIFCK